MEYAAATCQSAHERITIRDVAANQFDQFVLERRRSVRTGGWFEAVASDERSNRLPELDKGLDEPCADEARCPSNEDRIHAACHLLSTPIVVPRNKPVSRPSKS